MVHSIYTKKKTIIGIKYACSNVHLFSDQLEMKIRGKLVSKSQNITQGLIIPSNQKT